MAVFIFISKSSNLLHQGAHIENEAHESLVFSERPNEVLTIIYIVCYFIFVLMESVFSRRPTVRITETVLLGGRGEHSWPSEFQANHGRGEIRWGLCGTGLLDRYPHLDCAGVVGGIMLLLWSGFRSLSLALVLSS